jgi:hypothetical protein
MAQAQKLILFLFLLYLYFRPIDPGCKTCFGWLLNDVIKHSTLILTLIYCLPLMMSPHVCIVVYMWVHPACLLNQV